MKFLKFLSMAIVSPMLLLLLSCKSSGGASDTDFSMTAKVNAVGEKLEVEVISDEYNSGTFLVIYSDETDFLSEDGEQISVEDISVGDTVVIHYGGQVMMSLPPQIVAKSITVQ